MKKPFTPAWQYPYDRTDDTTKLLLNQCELIKTTISNMMDTVSGEQEIVNNLLQESLNAIDAAIFYLRSGVHHQVALEPMLYAMQSIGRAESMDVALSSMIENAKTVAEDCATIFKDKWQELQKNRSSTALDKRHAENRASKEFAMKYYAEHIDEFGSMDDAASAIAQKIVPYKFRTVRDWITEYHKKLRSTRTT